MTRIILAAVLAASLAGCGNSPDPDTLNALTGGLKAAEKAATVYVQLPLCPAVTLCREAGIAAKIGAADNVANDALAKYRAGGATAAIVSAAIAGMVAIIPASK